MYLWLWQLEPTNNTHTHTLWICVTQHLYLYNISTLRHVRIFCIVDTSLDLFKMDLVTVSLSEVWGGALCMKHHWQINSLTGALVVRFIFLFFKCSVDPEPTKIIIYWMYMCYFCCIFWRHLHLFPNALWFWLHLLFMVTLSIQPLNQLPMLQEQKLCSLYNLVCESFHKCKSWSRPSRPKWILHHKPMFSLQTASASGLWTVVQTPKIACGSLGPLTRLKYP